MVLATRHTGLVVREIDKSLDFYQKTLGLSVWKRAKEAGPFIEKVVGIEGVELEWVKLKTKDGSLLELLQYHSHPDTSAEIEYSPSNKLGCSHVAFTVKNIEALHSLLCNRGYHCNNSPQTSPNSLVKVLYCHDPDGILVELVEELSNE